jgi:hypothetical protein
MASGNGYFAWRVFGEDGCTDNIITEATNRLSARLGSCSVVIFCCEEAGILGDSSVVSSSLLIEISFDCSDSLSVGGPLWLVVFGLLSLLEVSLLSCNLSLFCCGA